MKKETALVGDNVQLNLALLQENLVEVLSETGESFGEHLLRLIDERDLTDAEVYKRASVDRKLFSKIRRSRNYVPRKRTVLCLACALELGIDEIEALLKSAGMAFSPGNRSDIIVRYCIAHNICDILAINVLLEENGERPLN